MTVAVVKDLSSSITVLLCEEGTMASYTRFADQGRFGAGGGRLGTAWEMAGGGCWVYGSAKGGDAGAGASSALMRDDWCPTIVSSSWIREMRRALLSVRRQS